MNSNQTLSTQNSPKHVKLALFWACLGAFSTMAVLPYALAASQTEIPVPMAVLALGQGLQSGLLLFFLSWLGLHLGQLIQLDSPLARILVYERVWPTISRPAIISALTTGLVAGFAIIALDVMFRPFMPPMLHPVTEGIALWKRLLGIFYGGIVEELMMRLFLMTFITWFIWKIVRQAQGQVPPLIYGCAIVIAALVFALGHLPLVATIWPLSAIVIIRTLILNMMGGIPFGWLYWRWGLEYAMFAHLMADIVLRIVGGS